MTHTFLPKILLFGFIILLSVGCTETTQSGERTIKDPGSSSGSKNTISLKFNGEKWALSESMNKPRLFEGGKSVLHFTQPDRTGNFDLVSLPAMRMSPEEQLASLGGALKSYSLKGFSIEGTQANGEWKFMTNKGEEVSAGDCTDFYLYGPEDGKVYLLPAPDPIDVAINTREIVFTRVRTGEKKVVARITSGTNLILHPCTELNDQNQVYIYQGGLGTIAIIDNIIDPDFYLKGSKGDAFSKKYISFRVRPGKKSRQTKEPCPQIDNIAWPETPMLCGKNADMKLTIYCNTILVAELPDQEPIRIDLQNCGARLQVSGDATEIYSGCESGTATCP